MPVKDIVGLTFGELQVIDFAGVGPENRGFWLCRCSCGRKLPIRTDALKSGRSKTCGDCAHDLTGMRFEKLVALEKAGTNKHQKRLWLCRCDCGKLKKIVASSLLNGHSKSCGCYRDSGDWRTTHGHTRNAVRTKIYTAWMNMRGRCHDPQNRNYASYGGLGIAVCDAWYKSFDKFLEDLGAPTSKDLTLERLDPTKNYEPGNVVWATNLVQKMNTRQNQHDFADLKSGMRRLCEEARIDFDSVFNGMLIGKTDETIERLLRIA